MLDHFILGNTNIIRNTVEPDHPSLAIIDSIAGSGVAIPGLSHATGIYNHTSVFQLQRGLFKLPVNYLIVDKLKN